MSDNLNARLKRLEKKMEDRSMTEKSEEQMMNEITRHMEEYTVNQEETQLVIRKMVKLGELLSDLPKEKISSAIDIAGEIANASVKAAFKSAKEAERVAELYSK